MMWKVDYSLSANRDLQEIHDYISGILLEPAIAVKQTNRIMDAVDSLDQMPLRHRLYDKEPWRSQGLRIMPVDNYVVLYLPDESYNTVTIVRIMYGGRDIEKQLSGYGEAATGNTSIDAIRKAQKAFVGIADELELSGEDDVQAWVDEIRYGKNGG